MTWSEIVINALITFAAVAAGVPVGLWLQRIRAEEVRKERRRSMFRVLQTSFESNLETMERAALVVGECSTDLVQVDTTWWKVVTGPHFEAIDDPLLLKRLGQVYVTLEQLNSCLSVWFQSMSSPLTLAVDGWKAVDAAHRKRIGDDVKSAKNQMHELLRVLEDSV